MAVVTSAWSTIANQVWASPTWSTDDPSYKLDTQLTNWINAINDTSVIEKIFDPGQATSRQTGDRVTWLLRARSEGDTSSDYGLLFFARDAGATAGNNESGAYYQRTEGPGNNGAGTYLKNTSSNTNSFSLAEVRSHFIAYEATGTLPWFVYSNINTSGNGQTHLLARVSTSEMTTGSYYPASGLGKWIYVADSSNIGDSYIYASQSRVSPPYIGFPSSTFSLRFFTPNPQYPNYFFTFPAVYGPSHFIGKASQDILLATTNTGGWGDTTIFGGVTYTGLRSHQSSSAPAIWVRTS